MTVTNIPKHKFVRVAEKVKLYVGMGEFAGGIMNQADKRLKQASLIFHTLKIFCFAAELKIEFFFYFQKTGDLTDRAR